MTYDQELREVAALFLNGQLPEGFERYSKLRQRAALTEMSAAKTWDEHQLAKGREDEAKKLHELPRAMEKLIEESARKTDT